MIFVVPKDWARSADGGWRWSTVAPDGSYGALVNLCGAGTEVSLTLSEGFAAHLEQTAWGAAGFVRLAEGCELSLEAASPPQLASVLFRTAARPGAVRAVLPRALEPHRRGAAPGRAEGLQRSVAERLAKGDLRGAISDYCTGYLQEAAPEMLETAAREILAFVGTRPLHRDASLGALLAVMAAESR